MANRRILITSALPYANGHIHLGHLVEYLMTDIWARFQRLRGHRCVYICADDTHGTAIMIRAQTEGRSEAAVIEEMGRAHLDDFKGFDIEFENYGSTNSESNREVATEIWTALRKSGLIFERSVEQLFDPEKGVFLADRFVKGTCPNCKAPDQSGDNCSVCGATYTPADLIDPRSTLSGAIPEKRSASHLFVDLDKRRDFLTNWTQSGTHLQPEIANYLKGYFLEKQRADGEGFEPLRAWDVSRPAPYFGFEIPDAPGHYWYVWFDAPIGYIGSTLDWCKRTGQDLASWWKSTDTEIHHVIGKDITYFHTLFWPAMLNEAGFTLPTRVQIHGFLTVNGEKMSKSTGTFVMASTYRRLLDPAYLRYFYASKLSGNVEDLDLNLEEFRAKVNSDLVGKVVNLVSRTARFAKSTGLSAAYPDDEGLFVAAAAKGEEIAAAYDSWDLARAMREIMLLADRANEYVARKEPWKLNKEGKAAEVQDVSTVALNLYRQLMVYLAPVLPRLAERCGEVLGAPIESWADSQTPLVGVPVGEFSHLMERVDPDKIKAMIEQSAESIPGATPAAGTAPMPVKAGGSSKKTGNSPADSTSPEPIAPEITIDEFNKIDLRVAEVVAAEQVSGSDKLLKLTLSLGTEQRTVFAGIKLAYDPATLVGRQVAMVANLAPRKMKFGLSEGMVLAAGKGGSDLFVLSPDSGALPGQRIR